MQERGKGEAEGGKIALIKSVGQKVLDRNSLSKGWPRDDVRMLCDSNVIQF